MTAEAPTRARTVHLPGRVDLDISEVGESDGTPVILLHGLSDSRRAWELSLATLGESMRVIAISQRGHGNSERPAGGYLPRDLSDDVRALLDTLEIESAVVVGHSMGSTIARRFAVDNPSRTRALVLVGSLGVFAGNPAIAELEAELAALTESTDPGFMREFQESTIAEPIPTAFLDTVIAEGCKVPPRVLRSALDGLIEDDVTRDLARISAPTLIIWGDRDAFCPRGDQDMLLGAIRDSRFSVYEGAGHALHWEQPERFAEEVAAFVAQLG